MFKQYHLACMLLGMFALSAGAQAAPMTFTTHLSGAAEDPPVDSEGIGQATVVLDLVEMTMAIEIWFSGLNSPTSVAHIHCCTAVPGEGNVGVATTLPTFLGFPAGVLAGTFSNVLDLNDAGSWNSSFVNSNGATFESAAAALGAGLIAGRAYVNIHTQAHPGGEIRGFLTATVPEPGTLGLVALGLAGMWLRRRRIGPAIAPS